MKASLLPLEKKVLSFFKEKIPDINGKSLVVAVSGGADSVALLTCLHRLSEELSLKLLCAHINHNLRGDESNSDEEYVRSLCEKYSVPCRVLSADVESYAFEHGLSTEEAGREIRYAFFEKCAQCLGEGALIATAHTLSDSVETFFFNAARGTGLTGLRGIPQRRGKIIRPLIECSRSEIEDYCHALGVSYVTDSSNLTDDYNRNKIRHGVVPVLKEINPSFENNLLSLMRTLSDTKNFVDSETEKLLEKARREGGFSALVLKEAPSCLKTNVALKIITGLGFSADYERATELAAAFDQECYRRELSKDRYIVVEKGLVFAEEKKIYAQKLPNTPFSLGKILFPNGKTAETELIEADLLNSKDMFKEYSSKQLLDYGKIHGEAVFRSREESDSVNLHGGTKSLKKLFNEHHLPPESRDGILLIADEQGVIWVEGLGTAKRCRVTAETKTVLGIKISLFQ